MIAQTVRSVGSISMLDGAGLWLELMLAGPPWPSHFVPESLNETFVHCRHFDGACNGWTIGFEDEVTLDPNLVRPVPFQVAGAYDFSARDRRNPPFLMTAPTTC